MAYSTQFRNDAVDAVAQSGGNDWFSLHTADPGTTGASEVVGGTYARVSAAFAAAATGSATNTPGATIDVPSGTTVTHWARWSLQSAGTFYAGGALPGGGETFGSDGTYTLTNVVTQPAA